MKQIRLNLQSRKNRLVSHQKLPENEKSCTQITINPTIDNYFINIYSLQQRLVVGIPFRLRWRVGSCPDIATSLLLIEEVLWDLPYPDPRYQEPCRERLRK